MSFFFFRCEIQSIGQSLKLHRQINKIVPENVKRTGTVVKVDVSSVAKSNFPSSVLVHSSPPKKEPGIALNAPPGSGCRISGLYSFSQFSYAVLNTFCLSRFTLQRHNDPSLAPSTLDFDSLGYQTRQQTAATATQGTVFPSQGSMITVILAYSRFHLFTRPWRCSVANHNVIAMNAKSIAA